MEKETSKNSFKKYTAVAGVILFSVFTIVFFQNCSGPGESTDSSSQAAGNGQPNTCPFSSNASPSVTSLSLNTLDFNIGMGRDSGTEATKSLTANFSSGDTNSAVVDVDCDVVNNQGLNVNCNAPNNPTRNGSVQIQISADNDAECNSGTVTVNVTVQDVLVNAQNAPINACNNLNRTSASRSFTVNVRNTCLNTQRLNPTNPYMTGQMGRTVAIDGDWAVTTAPGDEQIGVDAGAAYVMRRVGTTWSVVQKLIPSTLVAGNLLTGADIAGDFIALGAPLANASAGAAWIYQFNGTQWVEVKTLTPPTGGGGQFGSALAISGTNVAVGAPTANIAGTLSGAVHVYSGANWNTVTTLLPSGSTLVRGYFGTSLSYSGATLAVGAPFPIAVATRLESVYIFDNNVFAQKISNTANATDRFGFSVSLDGNNLAVGAPYHTARRGIAYLYQRAGGVFPATANRQYVLADPNNMDVDSFGYSVAVKGTRVVVSAPDKAEGNPKFGAVYLFGTNNNTQLYKIRSQTADRDADSFGYSVDVSVDGWLMSGALNDEHQAGIDNSGSVYMVRLP